MLEIAQGKHQSNHQLSQQRELTLLAHLKTLGQGQFSHEQRLERIPGAFQSVVPYDIMRFELYKGKRRIDSAGYYFHRVAFDEYQVAPSQALRDMAKDQRNTSANESLLPQGIYNGDRFEALCETDKYEATVAGRFDLHSSLHIQLGTSEEPVSLAFYSKKPDAYQSAHLQIFKKHTVLISSLLRQPGSAQVSDVVTSRVAIKDSVPTPKSTERPRFDGIYGNSEALMSVLDNIEMVANTPATVLVLGESGTGKERVAQSVHLYSGRKGKPFVTVNCAALPPELIESELFGHEKGAFTGAIEKRMGKFEMANGGTIFLDEIGEMPLESQVKLLRVLQEKEFEHIGSSKTVKVDVRVIAATNRNLEKEVAEGRFRLDLFYRLNVFPIELPPLRDRKKDIPVLAAHFLAKTAKAFGRSVAPELSAEALRQLDGYNWPGNIRELEHLMERTLIRTKDGVIRNVDLPVATAATAKATKTEPVGTGNQNLEKVEADHIIAVLRNCDGKVSGPGGAAEILGMPSTTLASKMKKLGIRKEHYYGK